MNKKILSELQIAFKNDYLNKTTYVPTNAHISQMFDIINNSGVFAPKLNKNLVLLQVVNSKEKQTSKGDFYECNDDKIKTIITITKSPVGDNFQKIVSTLCHEMIHMYDYFYGPLHQITNGNSMKVVNRQSRQIVNGRYDAHGRFFNSYISKFDSYGIHVKVSYSPKDVYFMKKLKENEDDIVLNYFSTINEDYVYDEQDEIVKKQLQQRADMIKCTNGNAKLIFIDKDHWAIKID